MQTIVLFSRSELTDLYGGISTHLNKHLNVIHLAYSNVEAKILREKYAIRKVHVFKEEVNGCIDSQHDFDKTIIELDTLIIKQTEGRFCLNSAIQSDRGFSLLSYEEALRLSVTYYSFWKKFLSKNKVEFILHEPTSLFFNHIASLVCKSIGAYYLSQIMVKSDKKYSFLYVADDNANAIELNNAYQNLEITEIQKNEKRINDFLITFRQDQDVFLSNIIKSKPPYLRILFGGIKSIFLKFLNIYKTDKIRDNTDYWILLSSPHFRRLVNLFNYSFKFHYDDYTPEINYFYYPLHLEPEAVVLYWGDGLYKNQIKLIENIAAQLPPKTFLLVKDHPHHIGYRPLNDYLALRKIPNIKIVNPTIPGKTLVKNSIGVITINGSAGFEGIIYNKPVYIFGNAFYSISNRVYKIINIRDLREKIYENKSIVFEDDIELHRFVLALFLSTHQGVVDYFAKRISKYQIDIMENAEHVSKSLINLTEKINVIQ